MEKDRDDNPAVALARLRWAKSTKEERSEVARTLNQKRWSTKPKPGAFSTYEAYRKALSGWKRRAKKGGKA